MDKGEDLLNAADCQWQEIQNTRELPCAMYRGLYTVLPLNLATAFMSRCASPSITGYTPNKNNVTGHARLYHLLRSD